MTKKTRKFLDLKEAFIIKEVLAVRVTKLDCPEGFCRYIDYKDSDATIAREMDFECHNHHVARVRREFFGDLHFAPTSPAKTQGIASWRESMEKLIAEQESRIVELERQLNAVLLRTDDHSKWITAITKRREKAAAQGDMFRDLG